LFFANLIVLAYRFCELTFRFSKFMGERLPTRFEVVLRDL
jgi:hypothetical protein